MTAPVRVLGANDLQPCGTETARKRHRAHGQTCLMCWPGDGLPPVEPPVDAATVGDVL